MNINITQPCPECQGSKIQLHPLWFTLYTRQEKEQDLSADAYFLEHHIVSLAERPKRIIPCTKCEGKGEVAKWVSLQGFLALLRQARLIPDPVLGITLSTVEGSRKNG